MRVLVTGASGFVGRHVVPVLLARGHGVTAVGRDRKRAEACEWFDRVTFVAADVHQAIAEPVAMLGSADLVMHLAWPGLPNYRQMFHLEENLPRDYRFIKSLVAAGYQRILVSGTCLETGIAGGCLTEGAAARPTLPYAIAKDMLHQLLVALRATHPFQLQWARLFYMFGQGQSPHSILAQLDRAIAGGAASFDMSGGEQLRDYSPVTQIAEKLVSLAEHPEWLGVTNICSGRPISVRRLVERHVESRGATIRLNLGVYPYAEDEPMALWGSSARLP